MKEREDITTAKMKHRLEMDALIESMNNQINELEEKLKSRERDLLDLNNGTVNEITANKSLTPPKPTKVEETEQKVEKKETKKLEPWKNMSQYNAKPDVEKKKTEDEKSSKQKFKESQASKDKNSGVKKETEDNKSSNDKKDPKNPKDPKDPKKSTNP
jgi:hypothetical protein